MKSIGRRLLPLVCPYIPNFLSYLHIPFIRIS
nr:MAG TPA: hypothetical protein [Bacteriophage sp.]DAX15041.1 MAG TPA: hypothetical protein [Bacteriophage sp.]